MDNAKKFSRVPVELDPHTREILQKAADRGARSLSAELRIAVRDHVERLRRRKP